MIYVAHRGNLNGRDPKRENHPDYLKEALDAGFSIEADFWLSDGELWLGHDEPQYKIPDWMDLTDNHFYCHAKNLGALEHLAFMGAHCFFHDHDEYVITSRGFIWTHVDSPCTGGGPTLRTFVIMPECHKDVKAGGEIPYADLRRCLGVCTDEVYRIKEGIES